MSTKTGYRNSRRISQTTEGKCVSYFYLTLMPQRQHSNFTGVLSIFPKRRIANRLQSYCPSYKAAHSLDTLPHKNTNALDFQNKTANPSLLDSDTKTAQICLALPHFPHLSIGKVKGKILHCHYPNRHRDWPMFAGVC